MSMQNPLHARRPSQSTRRTATDRIAAAVVEVLESRRLMASIGVAALDATASEAGTESGTFRFTRDDATGDLSFLVSYSGTATGADDYQDPNTTLQFLDGESTLDVEIIPEDDTDPESAETIIVTIGESPQDYSVTTGQASATINLADNDAAVANVGVTALDAAATEAIGNPGTYRFTRSSTAGTLTLNLTISGTATNGTDYNTIADTVSFAAGQATKDVVLTTKQDTTFEGSETAIVTIDTDAAYAITSGQEAATVTIADDDKPTVSVAATDAAAAEASAATGTWTLTRTGSTAGSLAVKYTMSGTATNGTDYASVSGTATFSAGAATTTVTLTPTDDSTLELGETAILTIAADTAYVVDTANAKATINIADNEIPQVNLVATDGVALEGSALDKGLLTVTRTGPTTEALAVKLTVGGTATGGTDYTTIPTTLTIPVGKASATIAVSSLQDTDLELSETVTVTLATDAAYTIETAKQAGTVTITDDEKPTISIAASDATANESGKGNTGKFTVTRTGPTTEAIMVPIVATGTATGAVDYRKLPTFVKIPIGKSSADVYVAPKDDDTLENDETIVATLGVGGFIPKADAKTATVTLVDDEVPVVTVKAADGFALEGSTTDFGRFTVTRSGAFAKALTVNVTIAGSATNGTDYDTIATTVEIPAGKPSVDVLVKTKEDTTLELTEKVKMTLGTGSGYDVDADDGEATVVVVDTEKPEVSLTASDAAAAEASTATGAFTITRTGPTTETLTVPHVVTGTAAKDADYAALAGKVTFGIGESSKVVTVTPVDDATVELDETVIATLTPGAAYTVHASDKTGTVTIAENDLPTVKIVASDGSTLEGSALDVGKLTISRNGPVANALTVQVTISGTATSGDDYTAVTTPVTIPAGKASVDVIIKTVQDTSVELGETVVATVTTNSAYQLDNDAKTATVNVVDDDKPVVSITATDANAAEGDATDTATITIARTGATTEALEVVYSSATGTATQGTDTTAVLPGKITLAVGESSKTITITTKPDTEFEGDETVILNLTAKPAAYTIDAAAKTATATVVEDDKPVVSIVATDADAKEGIANGGALTISRTGSTKAPLTVNLTTSGLATNGLDFNTVGPTVVIPAGKSFVSVAVVTKNDTAYEGTEDALFAVGTNAAYTIHGTDKTATVTIVDDEKSTVSVEATDAAADETGNAKGAFTFTRSGPTTDPVTVMFTVAGTAKRGIDYTNFARTVTIGAGEASATVDVTPSTDTHAEGDETAIIKLSPDATAYLIEAAKTTATVTIADAQKPTVSVEAVDSPAAETDATPAVFRIWRTGLSMGRTLAVKFALTGTATNVTDYAITADGVAVTNTVTIPAGDSYVDLFVKPVDDNGDDDDETIILTLTADGAYDVDGTDDEATITITDNDAAA